MGGFILSFSFERRPGYLMGRGRGRARLNTYIISIDKQLLGCSDILIVEKFKNIVFAGCTAAWWSGGFTEPCTDGERGVRSSGPI